MKNPGTPKPRLFVGSSVESLDVANAVQENLEHTAEVTVWTQGVFELSRTTIHTLMQAVDTYDFAVFVFAPDDIVKMRDQTLKTARDNVVFELGLFAGGLGQERAFIILPRGVDLHLPTDLAGMTPATYEPVRSDNNLVAALGPACARIRRAMEERGIRGRSSPQATLPTRVLIHSAIYSCNGKRIDVTEPVRARVAGKVIDIASGNHLGGDPQFGTPKKLTIDYSLDGVRRTCEVCEGDALTLQ